MFVRDGRYVMEWDRSLIMKRPAGLRKGICSTKQRRCWRKIDFDSGANYPQTADDTKDQTRKRTKTGIRDRKTVQKEGRS
jgi:hypothetical protein